MFREQRQYGNDPLEVRRSKTKFSDPLRWADGKLIFTCSWSDWFHPAADAWRDEAWDVVRRCPQHVFQILTKRPELALERLPADWGDGWPNVWLGVSVENARHTWRADVLREIPAALRFISAEPLLGSLYPSVEGGTPKPATQRSTRPGGESGEATSGGGPLNARAPLNLTGIGWVIVGGESGPRTQARSMHPAWAREIRDACLAVCEDCAALGAKWMPPDHDGPGFEDGHTHWAPCQRPAFHFKQWGAWQPDADGRDPNALFVLPDGSAASAFDVDRYGIDLDGAFRMGYAGPNPKAGGKTLDGVDWCEIPERPTLGQLTLA